MLLFNDDCMNVLKEFKSNSVDLVIVDPPYKMLPLGGGGWVRHKPYFKEIRNWNEGIDNEVLDELVRIMKRVNIYIFCSKGQLHQYLEYFNNVSRNGKKVEVNFDLLVWHKVNPLPLCANKYLSDLEYIVFFREKGVKINGSYRTKSKLFSSNVNKSDKEKYHHPTVKPLELIDRFVENSSVRGDIVLDCYMGTGTTGVSALSKGRRFVGVEIDEKHFITASARLSEYED